MTDLNNPDTPAAPEALPEPEQPPIGGFCEGCGHFAGRHDETGCHFDRPDPQPDCDCTAMLWQDRTWPRPWLPAPAGLIAVDPAGAPAGQ